MPSWPSRVNFIGPPLSPGLCCRFVLSNPHIHVVLTGPQNREQLRQNLEVMAQGPLAPDEMDWIRHYGRLVKLKKRLDTEMKRMTLGLYSPEQINAMEVSINPCLFSYLSTDRHGYSRPFEAVESYANGQTPWL